MRLGDTGYSQGHAQQWLNLMNQGGLLKCNIDFYEFLRCVELEMKAILPSTSSSNIGELGELSTTIAENGTVLEMWKILVNNDTKTTDKIKEIITIYTKIHIKAYIMKLMEALKKGKTKICKKPKLQNRNK